MPRGRIVQPQVPCLPAVPGGPAPAATALLGGAAWRHALAYTVLAAALIVHGEHTLALSLPMVLGVLWLVLRADREGGAAPPRGPVALLVILSALSLAVVPGAAPRPLGLVTASYLLRLAMLLTVVLALRSGSAGTRTLGLLLLLFLLAGLLQLHLCPAPRIDVFHLQQLGARELLGGRNPYEAILPNDIYSAAETRAFFGDERRTLTNYPYPPLSLLVTLPGYALGRDVRLVYLGLQGLCAPLLYALARRGGHSAPAALVLAALHLLHPRSLFVVEQAWTEPLMAAAALALLLALAHRPSLLAGGALGLVLAAKQYSVVLLPLLLSRRHLSRRQVLVGLALAAFVTAPFLLWGPRAFVEDVVLFQLRQPFRMDALSVPAALAHLIGLHLPGALALVVGLGAAAWAARSRPGEGRGLAAGMALAMLCFFLSAKQAFFNYYYLVGVLLLGAAARPSRD